MTRRRQSGINEYRIVATACRARQLRDAAVRLDPVQSYLDAATKAKDPKFWSPGANP